MEAAFFDLDKTVIARASMVAFGRPLYREGLVSRALLLRALWGQLVYLHLGADEARLARMRAATLALTRGWHRDRVTEIVEAALAEVVEPIIYEEALDLLRAHRDAGRLVVIVSAAPEEVVRPMARYLGADVVVATRARVDGDGRYTGEVEVDAFGPHKADIMRRMAAERGVDLSASFAYSDSATDIPMLEAVGHPVAVNPDRELQRVARDRGWEIRRFVNPVRLRDRVGMPPVATTAVGGGAAAALIAGAVVWWRLRRPPQPGDVPAAAPGRTRHSLRAAMAASTTTTGTRARLTAARPRFPRRALPGGVR